MSKIIILFSVSLFGITLTEQASFLNHDYIDSINKIATTWKAGKNFDPDTPKDTILSLLGSREIGNIKRVKEERIKAPYKTDDPNYVSDYHIFKHFDARKRWIHCPTVKEVRDQGKCGCGWAFSTTGAFADRMCIATNGKFKRQISAEHLTFCCEDCGSACKGGYPILGWWFIHLAGVVSGGSYNTTDGCQPYRVKPCLHGTKGEGACSYFPPEEAHECSTLCYGDPSIQFMDDRWRTREFYYLTYPTIQKEVQTYGPVAATIEVYDDFLSYKTGVYIKTENAKYLGDHAVKLIGWGVEHGVEYWLMMNSWGTSWGDNGLFKIRKGTNECMIEEWICGGVPEAGPDQ